MNLVDIERLVQIAGTIFGVAGGLFGLYKFYSARRNKDVRERDKEIREWQKVVIYKIFRQDELKVLKFNDILRKFRSEAQAYPDYNIEKKEISEDSLRRVLLDLVAVGILLIRTSDSFRFEDNDYRCS